MPKVILADDDPDYREAFTAGMEALGHSVTTVPSGAEVMEAVAEHAPDIVFLDVLMPGGGAISRVHELRGARDDLPVVVITGNTAVYSSPIVTEGMRSANARVPKSMSLAEIGALIDRLLAEARGDGTAPGADANPA